MVRYEEQFLVAESLGTSALHNPPVELADAHHNLQDKMFERELYQQQLENRRIGLEEQLNQKEALLAESQQDLTELRETLSDRQKLIEGLQDKVDDLNYEIKTLLHLADIDDGIEADYLFDDEEEDLMVVEEIKHSYRAEPEDELALFSGKLAKTFEEASRQLKRGVDIAQKITGANLYQQADGRYRDVSFGNLALDLRHLFDNLRSEHDGVILFYSQKEKKLIFVSAQVKHLMGWSPDKVMQNFEDLILKGLEDWREAIAKIGLKVEVQVSMMFKAKTGADASVNALMSAVPSGLFKQDVVIVLY